jgi:hypothetical protein
MKKLKATLASFTENELPNNHKIKIYGGIADGSVPPPIELPELPLEDEEDDTNGEPGNATGPRGGGGTSTAVTGSSRTRP